MKSVSRAYKSSMKQTLRERSSCIVTFGNTDITAITDGTWSGTGASISSFETLDYEKSFNNTIAALELNRWCLDGTNSIKRENDGYVASSFGSATISKVFTNYHAFNGVTLTFDTRENEWPFAVKLTYYSSLSLINFIDSSGNNIITDANVNLAAYKNLAVVAETTVYPTSTTCEITLNGTGIDRIDITFIAELPSRRARLEHIAWGVASVFDDSRLISVKQSHDVDPLSRRLPDEKLTFTVEDYSHQYDPDNPSGVYSYLNKGAPVSVSYGYDVDGTIEWVKADHYSLEDIPTFKDNRVTFSTVGLIGSMSGTYYKDTYNASGKTLYALANSVLTDAGLPLTSEGENPWDIDTTLQSMSTTAVLPIDTHANLLQMIAHAGCCRLFTDDDNIIHLKAFGVTPSGIFDGTYTDNGHISYSEWDSVDYGNDNVQETATLELNKWVLDGTGLIGKTVSGYVSDVSSSQYGVISTYWEKTFDVTHDLPIITITFDKIENTWPFKIGVQYYDESGTLLDSETAYPTSTECEIQSSSIEDCKKIKVTEYATLPYTRSRITKVSFRETDFSLTQADIKENGFQTSKLEKLRNVLVTEYAYTVSNSSTTLFEGDTTLTQVHVEYSAATNITVTVTGGTVSAQNVYAQAADLTLSAGSKHILITGYTIESNETVHTTIVNTTGEDDTETNMLITSKSMADALEAHVEDYLSLRNTYDASYRGNPELEVGDIIELQTQYSNVVYGLVLTDEISYNGALSGKVKVKGLLQ